MTPRLADPPERGVSGRPRAVAGRRRGCPQPPDRAPSRFRRVRAGTTVPVTVHVANARLPETVEVDVLKSTPFGFEFVGTTTQQVPVRKANQTTDFKFNYTFTTADAAIGKVTFKAVASLVGARDALPTDNEAISAATKVRL